MFLLTTATFGVSGAAWAQDPCAGGTHTGRTTTVECLSISGDFQVEIENANISGINDSSGPWTAIRFTQTGDGDLDIIVEDSTLNGALGQNDESHGIWGTQQTAGSLDISVTGSTITTSAPASSAVLGLDESGLAGDINIVVQDSTITTSGGTGSTLWGSNGVLGKHDGVGDVNIDVRNSRITTSGSPNFGHGPAGVFGWQSTLLTTVDTETLIKVKGGSIMTSGDAAHGVYGRSETRGNVDIRVEGVSITTNGGPSSMVYDFDVTDGAYGIYGQHVGDSNSDSGAQSGEPHARTGSGDIDIRLTGGSVTTSGEMGYGIYGRHDGIGNIDIEVGGGGLITTSGAGAHGIVAYHFSTADTKEGSTSGVPISTDSRATDITVGGPITVSGQGAQGIRIGAIETADDSGTDYTSGLSYPVGMATLATKDDEDMGRGREGHRLHKVTVNAPVSSAAEGVFLANGGWVVIGPKGSIRSDSGIAILATGTVPGADDHFNPNYIVPDASILPKLWVDLNLGGRQVSQVIGDNRIVNDGGETTIAVNNVVLHDGATGVTGRTAPNGAWDVRMLASDIIVDRDFSAEDFAEDRVQVEVDEAVSAGPDDMAGVHVEGGGEVHIGAQGSINAASGIAILATRAASGEPPELLVDMDLSGRQVSQVIGDDWIINDGGGTTLVINGVKLHDATTGVVPGAVAPNGAFNVQFQTVGGLQAQTGGVQIRKEGVRVLDRTDPNPANWVVSDPEAGVIADRDFSAADFIDGSMLTEEYAPRSALYEALPDVLLRLQHRDAVRAPRSRPERSQWIRVTGRTGSQDFKRSTVGIEYDTDYFEVEAGKHVLLDNGLDAWAALHYLDGTADVSSPVRGGDIDVRGLGLSLELCRGCESGDWYVSGRLALSRYDLDLSSDERGRLKSGADATAWGVRLEAGQRLQRWSMQLTPRIRLEHANVSVDRFTDAVDARVSYSDEDRSAVALGVMVESASPATESGPSLWGSLDFEHRLGDGQTTARVSETSLTARPETNSLLLGVGGTWRRGDLTIDAGLSAREELSSGGEEYGATFSLDLQF